MLANRTGCASQGSVAPEPAPFLEYQLPQITSEGMHSLSSNGVDTRPVELLPLSLGPKVLGLREAAKGALCVRDARVELAQLALGRVVALAGGRHIYEL